MTSVTWLSTLLAGLAVAAALPGDRCARTSRPAPRSGRSREPEQTSHRRPLVALAVAAGVVALVGGAIGAALGLGAGTVTWLLMNRMETPEERRRRESLRLDLPHVVDLLAASLSAGSSVVAAAERVADAVDPPISREIDAVASRLRMGAEPIRVWSEVAAHPELGPLGRSLLRATESGVSVAEAMHRLADDLRHSARAEVESRARSVGVKAAAPLGICLLPAFVLVGVVPLVAGSVTALMTG